MSSCIYCGEAADALDHVIPRSYLSSSKRSGRPGHEPGFRVPACTQCNSILGDRIFDNLVERKRFVYERLVVKLRRWSAIVQWDEIEQGQLGPNLRHIVDVQQAKCRIARDRLRYAAAPPDRRWLNMEERWRLRHGDDPVPPESRIRTVDT